MALGAGLGCHLDGLGCQLDELGSSLQSKESICSKRAFVVGQFLFTFKKLFPAILSFVPLHPKRMSSDANLRERSRR